MLKIKDNVDLKQLEKFGFKAVFNKDDGKLDYMFLSHKLSNEQILYCKQHYSNSMFSFTRNKKSWIFFHSYKLGYAKYFADVLYDLIKADLVEKVEKGVI